MDIKLRDMLLLIAKGDSTVKIYTYDGECPIGGAYDYVGEMSPIQALHYLNNTLLDSNVHRIGASRNDTIEDCNVDICVEINQKED